MFSSGADYQRTVGDLLQTNRTQCFGTDLNIPSVKAIDDAFGLLDNRHAREIVLHIAGVHYPDDFR